ncbi:uncharacterized protein LOC109604271 [Aethina tumida]|uniref:uncharacterized protein LOC109604271 n=1 Tax=Aethina tumida TaxID=116153 RepID=UPI00096B24D7|nr:uncharacterized protein LOC109604271 [Aethina tumida]
MSSRFAKDLIVKNQILADQKKLEEKASKEWHSKFGYLLDFDKMVIEEAKERGMTEEEFRRITVKRKDKTMHKNLQNFDIKPSGKIPVASSGYVGWRSQNNIDRLVGPLHVDRKYTLPQEISQKHILLG